ncbi:MAG TPA: HAMP domain-containing sensor histidine kinase [Polyangiaceae bacterium]|nr:HAMP domain-containing sensor histidine kinase [Polyangiaceae bacterium]
MTNDEDTAPELHDAPTIPAPPPQDVGSIPRPGRVGAELGRLEPAAEYAAMGRVAAGAAYELDPPLSRLVVDLRMLLELYETSLPEDDAVDNEPFALLQRALESAERLTDTVRGLRAFTSVADDEHGVDVHEAIEIAVHLTMQAIAPRAGLLRRYCPAPRVRGSLGRIVQVLSNVLQNAAESIPTAVPQANSITIQTDVDREGRVTIDVIDTGLGVDDRDLPFVFGPFFTTKPAAQGLGLASARLALLEAGGDMTLDSVPGRGCHVRITLPAAEPAEGVLMPVFESTQGPARRVLCVAGTAAGARSLGDVARDREVELLYATWSDALERLARGEPFDLVLCESDEARRAAFRERLALVAPSVLARTFGVVLRSRASGTFARARNGAAAAAAADGTGGMDVLDPSDSRGEIDLAPSKTAW